MGAMIHPHHCINACSLRPLWDAGGNAPAGELTVLLLPPRALAPNTSSSIRWHHPAVARRRHRMTESAAIRYYI